MTRFLALMTAAVLLPGAALAQDRFLTVTNASPDTLVELYAAPAGSADWGPDLMGGQTLATGEAGDLMVAGSADDCAFALRMVFASGASAEAATDLCQTTGFTIE
jgi:hypothetical protein